MPRKGTSGNNAQFTYDFGIAIAQGTVNKIKQLTGATLTLAGAFYALKSSASEYVDTLKKNTLIFGGQISAIKAMNQAQDRLIKGISHFSVDDQLNGMRQLAAVGIDARKNLEWIDKAAHATGKSFAEFSGAISSAIQGNMGALVDMGLITQRATRMFDKYQGNTIMRQQAILNFVKQHKGLQNAIMNDFETVKDQMIRIGESWKRFLQTIVGKPNDPGSLYGTVVQTFKNIADAISRNQVAIQNAGAAIGMTLTWMVRNVGHVLMWMGRQVKKAIDFVGLSSDSFIDKLRSFFVWLEFWKVHIVNFLKDYGKTILKVTAITLGLVWAFKKVALQLRYLEMMGPVIGKSFGGWLQSLAVFMPKMFRKIWIAVGNAFVGNVYSPIRIFLTATLPRMILGVAKTIIGLIRLIGTMFTTSNPIGWIVLAVAALVTLYKKCEIFRKYMNTIFAFIINQIRFTWNLLNGAYVAARVALATFAGWFRVIGEKIGNVFKSLKEKFSGFWEWLSNTKLFKWLNKLTELLQKPLAWVRGKGNDFADKVQAFGEEHGVQTRVWRAQGEPDLTRDYLDFSGMQNPLTSAMPTPGAVAEAGSSTMNFNQGAIQIVVQKGEGIDETKLAQKIAQVVKDLQRDNLIKAGA